MAQDVSLIQLLLLPLLGFLVALLGTSAGLGGGFLLVPVLLVLFPEAGATTVAFVSLTVVLVNALSGTIANIRAGRIDYRTAGLLAVGALPAAVGGAVAARLVDRTQFETAFGLLLLFGSVYVFWRSLRAEVAVDHRHDPNRRIQERRGPLYLFYVNGLLAAAISPTAGFLSSLFGIGGGVLHVPSLTFILRMPFRIAAATSLFVLVPTALVGLLAHLAAGEVYEGWQWAGLLSVGALAGAQLAVLLGRRVNQRLLLSVLSVGLLLVGIRQLSLGLAS